MKTVGPSFAIEKDNPIRLHWTLLVLLAWLPSAALINGGGLSAVPYGLGFLGLFLLSLMMHEFGHLGMARLLGAKSGPSTVSPIGRTSPDSHAAAMPTRAAIALSGPAMSFLLGCCFLIAASLEPFEWRQMTNPFATEVGLATNLAAANFLLAALILVPVHPHVAARIYGGRGWLSKRDTLILAGILVLLGLFLAPVLMLLGMLLFFIVQEHQKELVQDAAEAPSTEFDSVKRALLDVGFDVSDPPYSPRFPAAAQPVTPEYSVPPSSGSSPTVLSHQPVSPDYPISPSSGSRPADLSHQPVSHPTKRNSA